MYHSDIGIDGMNLQAKLAERYSSRVIEKKSLYNQQGKAYAHFAVAKGKLDMGINFPLSVRSDNVLPFSKLDMSALKDVRSRIVGELEWWLGENDIICNLADCVVTTTEVNCTGEVVDGCLSHQVVNLVNRSIYHSSNKVYQRASIDCPYVKEDESVLAAPNKGNSLFLYKAYDKTQEQINSGNRAVRGNLFRLEIVFKRLLLGKLFKANFTLNAAFEPTNLLILFDEYRRILKFNLFAKHINPCLQEIEDILFNNLIETRSAEKTIARYREIIVDKEVLRRALKRSYAKREMPDNSKQDIRRLKKYKLPIGVEESIRQFEIWCD